MNVDITVESSVLEHHFLEALSTAVFYRNALESIPGGYDLLNDPKYRKLLEQLCSAITADSTRTTQVATNVFRLLQDAIDDGTYQQKYPVGTILKDTWTDRETGTTYNMPLRIVDYRGIVIQGHHKVLGAILMRTHASPNEVAFDLGVGPFSCSKVLRYLSSDLTGGYLAGCSAELLASMATIAVDTPCGVDVVDRVFCQFFLPSPEELHINSAEQRFSSEAVDRLAWEYYRDTPMVPCDFCTERIFTSFDGSKKSIWLRASSDEPIAYTMSTSGNLGQHCSSNLLSVAPACAITGLKLHRVILDYAD